MTTVKVYRFEKYDVGSDQWQRSRRWATADAIERVHGQRVGKPIDVDESLLGREVDGMTDRDLSQNASDGFQRNVMR